MSSAPVPVVIVYLGSRGAGPKLLLGVGEKLHLEKIPFYLVVSSTNELLGDVYSKFHYQSRIVELKSKFSLLSISVYRDPNSVLFIGRQRKYKGGKLLANSWPKVLEKLPSAKLIVAGEGQINQSFFKLKNVTILNHWLNEYEIGELLQASSVVVFPYFEASQSGLIASAHHYGTKIVSTAVGGLTEQTIFFGGTLVEAMTPYALAEKIVESLTSQKVIEVKQILSSPSVDLYNFVCSLAK
jgi:glycosyltransferase involved in cell wall biosynthesis